MRRGAARLLQIMLTNDDLQYDPSVLLAAAKAKPAAAIRNAENWTQFYFEFVSNTTTAGGGGKSGARTGKSPRESLGRCGGDSAV